MYGHTDIVMCRSWAGAGTVACWRNREGGPISTDKSNSGDVDSGGIPSSYPVLSRTDELVRAAMRSPAWAQVTGDTREALRDLYAYCSEIPKPADPGAQDRELLAREAQFRTRLDEVVSADPILSYLVVQEAATRTEEDHRGVLPLPARIPEPVRWACLEPDCTQVPVSGEYDGPYGSRTCSEHPGVTLQRLS